MTVQPRATKVALAANPVADGVDEVPVIVTTRLLKAVVPSVPLRAASLTKMLSTDAWLRAAEVMTTLPAPLPTCLRVDGNWNVVNLGRILFKLITLPEVTVVPIRSITGTVIELSCNMIPGLNPRVTVFNAGKLNEVRALIVLGLKLPPTVVNAGKLNEVRAAIVVGLKLLPTVVNAGTLNEVRETIEVGVKLPPTVVNAGKLNEVRAAMV